MSSNKKIFLLNFNLFFSLLIQYLFLGIQFFLFIWLSGPKWIIIGSLVLGFVLTLFIYYTIKNIKEIRKNGQKIILELLLSFFANIIFIGGLWILRTIFQFDSQHTLVAIMHTINMFSFILLFFVSSWLGQKYYKDLKDSDSKINQFIKRRNNAFFYLFMFFYAGYTVLSSFIYFGEPYRLMRLIYLPLTFFVFITLWIIKFIFDTKNNVYVNKKRYIFYDIFSFVMMASFMVCLFITYGLEKLPSELLGYNELITGEHRLLDNIYIGVCLFFTLNLIFSQIILIKNSKKLSRNILKKKILFEFKLNN